MIGDDRVNIEMDALKTALYIGHVLKREVILPRFHLFINKTRRPSSYVERPLNTWIKISKIDSEFYERYRENSFLEHPKVPPSIKDSIRTLYWIKTNSSSKTLAEAPSGVTVLTPVNNNAATADELRKWFGDQQTPVLRLHSTYGIFGGDTIPNKDKANAFHEKLERAFVHSTYMQITESHTRTRDDDKTFRRLA
jgi:hypothetical protein